MNSIGASKQLAGILPKWFPDLSLNQAHEASVESRFEGIQMAQHQRIHYNSTKDFEYSAGRANRGKNRYYDILPFDYNRIVLTGACDYINSSLLSTPCGLKKYIASQGPLPETIPDFWQMIWEKQVSVIVMLTNEKEGQRVKCHKYWPDDEQSLRLDTGAGLLEVIGISDTLVDEQIRERKLLIKTKGQERQISMIHLVDWPDHGTVSPKLILSVIEITNIRLRGADIKGPPVIHCSAGVGRTGTFCVVDSVLTYIQNELEFDLQSVSPQELSLLCPDLITLMVNHFRKQRIHIVQSVSQFRLCYEAVLLSLTEQLGSS